jgi:hypothetical protein
MATERVPVDAYVIDSLMPDLVGHDRKPSAFVVYLLLWRRTRGASRATSASYQMIADGTGLSKGSAQAAVQWLVRRGLVDAERRTATSAPILRLKCHWRER